MAEILTKSISYANNIFSQFFIKLIIAIVILLIGFIIGKIAGKLIQKLFHEIELNKNLKKTGINLSLEEILSHTITYIIYFISSVWALTEIGLATTVLNMIAAAALILIIISILLAIKDFMPNAIAGIMIYQKQIIKQGDVIKINKIEGKVMKISLIETEIESKNKDTIHIPNSTLIKKEVIVRKNRHAIYTKD